MRRYDLSRVGRMKVNSRFGRPEITGPMTLTHEDIADTIRSWSSCVMAAVRSTTSITWVIAAFAWSASSLRISSVPGWYASSVRSRNG